MKAYLLVLHGASQLNIRMSTSNGLTQEAVTGSGAGTTCMTATLAASSVSTISLHETEVLHLIYSMIGMQA